MSHLFQKMRQVVALVLVAGKIYYCTFFIYTLFSSEYDIVCDFIISSGAFLSLVKPHIIGEH